MNYEPIETTMETPFSLNVNTEPKSTKCWTFFCLIPLNLLYFHIFCFKYFQKSFHSLRKNCIAMQIASNNETTSGDNVDEISEIFSTFHVSSLPPIDIIRLNIANDIKATWFECCAGILLHLLSYSFENLR